MFVIFAAKTYCPHTIFFISVILRTKVHIEIANDSENKSIRVPDENKIFFVKATNTFLQSLQKVVLRKCVFGLSKIILHYA